MASCILLNLKEKKLIQLEMGRILIPRGVLGSVWSVLYVYGQPKPTEMVGNRQFRWYFGFSRFRSGFSFPKTGSLRIT